MPKQLHIALVAHDTKKEALIAWAKKWEHWLAGHLLVGTGSSAEELEHACPSLKVGQLKSGPDGGDMQIGARIVEGAVDVLIFLPDPMNPHPHEADFQALIRIALMVDIPFALSATGADFIAKGIAATEEA